MSSIIVTDRPTPAGAGGGGGVVDIKISGAVLWSSFEDINHDVSLLVHVVRILTLLLSSLRPSLHSI